MSSSVLATAMIQILPDMNALRDSMSKVRKSFTASMQSLSGVADSINPLKKLNGTLAQVGISLGAIASIRFGARVAMDAESSAVAFEVMLGSAAKAKKMLDEIQEYANNSPFNLIGTREAAQLMMNFGIAAKDVMPSLKMLGDIAAGDANKLSRLALAFAQTKAAGKLMGQDLLQYVNAGFNPLQEMSRKTGVSMNVLRARMSAGQISFNEVAKAMKSATEQGGRFYGMTSKMQWTVKGLMSTLSDNVSKSAGKITQILIEAFNVKHLIQGAITATGAVEQFVIKSEAKLRAFSAFMIEFGQKVYTNISEPFVNVKNIFVRTFGPSIKSITSFMMKFRDQISEVAAFLVSVVGPALAVAKVFMVLRGAVLALRVGILAMNMALMANPIYAIAAAAVLAGLAIYHWRDAIMSTIKSLYETNSVVRSLVDWIIYFKNKAVEGWNLVASGAAIAWTYIKSIAASAWSYILQIAADSSEAISSIWLNLKDIFFNICEQLKMGWELVGEIFWNVVGFMQEAIGGFVSYLSSAVMGVCKYIDGLFVQVFGMGFGQTIREAIAYVVEFVNQTLNVVSLLTTSWDATWIIMKNSALDMLDLVWLGVLETFKKIKDKLTETANATRDWFAEKMIMMTAGSQAEADEQIATSRDISKRKAEAAAGPDATTGLIGDAKKRMDKRADETDGAWKSAEELRDKRRADRAKAEELKTGSNGATIYDFNNPDAPEKPKRDHGELDNKDAHDSGAGSKKKEGVSTIGLAEMHAKIQGDIGKKDKNAETTAKNTSEMVDIMKNKTEAVAKSGEATGKVGVMNQLPRGAQSAAKESGFSNYNQVDSEGNFVNRQRIRDEQKKKNEMAKGPKFADDAKPSATNTEMKKNLPAGVPSIKSPMTPQSVREQLLAEKEARKPVLQELHQNKYDLYGKKIEDQANREKGYGPGYSKKKSELEAEREAESLRSSKIKLRPQGSLSASSSMLNTASPSSLASGGMFGDSDMKDALNALVSIAEKDTAKTDKLIKATESGRTATYG